MTTKLALIDPNWEATDPDTEAEFFLIQQMVRELGGQKIWQKGVVEQLLKATERTPNVIVDNGAYEGQGLERDDLIRLIEDLVEPCLQSTAAVTLPVFVTPDFPGQPFSNTVDMFFAFREYLNKRLLSANRPPLMLVPHSQPGDMDGFAAGVNAAIELGPEWIGLSILACPYVASIWAPRETARFDAGPEASRGWVCNQLGPQPFEAMKLRGIKLHFLGIGWDWWQLTANSYLRCAESIDTHKPVTYADAGMLMQPWLTIDRKFQPQKLVEPLRQVLLDSNVALLKAILS